MTAQALVEVAAAGLVHDSEAQHRLASRIKNHGATILVMTLGAPVSEIFVHANRVLLPGCWALCVGQALRVELELQFVRQWPCNA